MSSERVWRKRFQDRLNAGLTIKEYCAEHEIARNTWYKAFNKYKAPEKNFDEVSIKPRIKSKALSINFEISESGLLKFSGSTNDSSIIQNLFGGAL